MLDLKDIFKISLKWLALRPDCLSHWLQSQNPKSDCWFVCWLLLPVQLPAHALGRQPIRVQALEPWLVLKGISPSLPVTPSNKHVFFQKFLLKKKTSLKCFHMTDLMKLSHSILKNPKCNTNLYLMVLVFSMCPRDKNWIVLNYKQCLDWNPGID